MPVVGGLDIHRKRLIFDYLDTVTGEVRRGQIVPADREHLRAWLARFASRGDVAFAVEGCTGWRYVAGERAAAGIAAHLAEPADTAAARGRKRHTRAEHLASLRTETAWAAALLAAAGIDACVVVNLPGLAAPAEQVLAWPVREAVVNMLRHSEARTCSITGWWDGGTARLEIINDHARAQADISAGLAERARAFSGSVSARATSDGGFRLLVEIPEEAT